MKTLSILFCFLFAVSANSFTTARAQVDVNDSLALVDLYNSTNGPGWRYDFGWLTTYSLSTWYGIKVTGTRVTGIDLNNNYLKGSIPSSIGNLVNLQYLNLYANELSDSIPFSIGNLIKLQALFLYYNQLSGSIPSSIGDLAQLQGAYLYNNKLSGAIPSSIGNLVNLHYFNLSSNQLTSSIPSSIGNLVNLSQLDLSGNHLRGAIPSSISNLVKLESLYLNYNQLSGSIPSSIGNLVNLNTLGLGSNKLSGSIPSSIGNLVNLTDLYLNYNQLSSSIPASIGNLVKLGWLDLSLNQLSGSLPASMGNLVYLSALYLRYNQLSGGIPYSFHKLKNLFFVYLDHNQLALSNDANFPMAFPLEAYIHVNDNHNNFNGLEFAVKKYKHFIYAPQATIPVLQNSNTLFVYAGGTISNNTFNWYRVGIAGSTTKVGDSTFTPTQSGKYYARVTNAIATKLTLRSDTIDFTMNTLSVNKGLTADVNSSKLKQALRVSPNPAGSIVNTQLNGTATIILTNNQGKVLLKKSISNIGDIDVSPFANSVYYVKNQATGEIQKIIVSH